MLRRNRRSAANLHKRGLRTQCRLQVESLETRTMLSASAGAFENPMVDAGAAQFDSLAGMIADGTTDKSPTPVHETQFSVAIESQNAIGPGILERSIFPQPELFPHDVSFFLDSSRYGSPLANVVSDQSLDFRLAMPDADTSPVIDAGGPFGGDSGLDWAYGRPAAIDQAIMASGGVFEPGGLEPGALPPLQFAPDHERSLEVIHLALSIPRDLLPVTDLIGDAPLHVTRNDAPSPVSRTLASVGLASMQVISSIYLSGNGSLLGTAYATTAVLASGIDLVEYVNPVLPLDSTTGLASGATQAERGATNGVTRTALSQPADSASSLSTQLESSGLLASEHGVEGGFIEIGVDPRSGSQTNECREDDGVVVLPWSHRARGPAGSNPWPRGDDRTTQPDIGLDLRDDCRAAKDQTGDGEADALAQEETCVCDSQEGGMIALAAGTDFAALTSDALTLSAASTPESAAGAPARDVEIDNGVGLFQAFELAEAPTECVSYFSSTSPPLEGTDAPGQRPAAVPAGDAPVTEDSAAAKTESGNQRVDRAANVTTMVAASLVTVVVGRRRKESPSDRSRGEARQRRSWRR